jgi:hypothetical protein
MRKKYPYKNRAKTLPNTPPRTETETETAAAAAPVCVAETPDVLAVAFLLAEVDERMPEELEVALDVVPVPVLVDEESVVVDEEEEEDVEVDVEPVEELLLLLPTALETSNCADCARMPVLSSSLETKLIW